MAPVGQAVISIDITAVCSPGQILFVTRPSGYPVSRRVEASAIRRNRKKVITDHGSNT